MNTLMRRRLTLIVLFSGIFFAMLGTVVTPTHRLLYNVSDSAPHGWYLLVPETEIVVGTLVFVRLSKRVAELADRRGYLPKTVPLLKRVAANSGHQVCALGTLIWIDGKVVARSVALDGEGRILDRWHGCRLLERDELFLMGTEYPNSFDSRYFGPVNAAQILGRAVPLWTW